MSTTTLPNHFSTFPPTFLIFPINLSRSTSRFPHIPHIFQTLTYTNLHPPLVSRTYNFLNTFPTSSALENKNFWNQPGPKGLPLGPGGAHALHKRPPPSVIIRSPGTPGTRIADYIADYGTSAHFLNTLPTSSALKNPNF